MKRIVCVSGGFDPLHFAHVDLIQSAHKWGDDVVVILNTDEWLMRKKGYVFMPWDERKIIMKSIKGVSDVVKAKDDDNTVCDNLRDICPYYFANGGDRGKDNTPEQAVCEELGIKMLWGIGGDTKPQSSSWLVERAVKQINDQNH